ncbi:phenylalanine--tRNA ligase subunit beta [Enterobacteriaceae endosymbiont of Donacia semicuprea]|uniref:phenylalanine--tRNA ligase subunit beta n=1 Tax=Enterobacteriaceae endosymbiont of Donacia semicuprea TaxID=2675783 RepID=UPI001449DD5C|nr:phenylalanine--tRNA ligase subunit beta [Enterobacteriaceae endosymbiont of Donacia semicuprea]QJC32791.1 phenylalanine--tRNA ligase subunit beta [Enterobacteriaceae endosymbiont of Donacia semicuprea]
MIKLSESWLREWLKINEDINVLSKKLTKLGFEVEKIEHICINNNYDNILYINIPFNRPDCLSILGLSRDLSTLYNKSFFKNLHDNFLKKTKKYNINIFFDKKIEKKLYQYNYCIIKNINFQKKKFVTIKNRLHQSGLYIHKNPILNIRNYIFLELGYPIQFYDFNKIKGNIYITDNKKNKFNFIDTENQKINFDSNNLLIIKDNNKILSIPAITQNKKIIVELNTKDILIECLLLNKVYINSLFKKFNFHNNISNMYTRYLDPLITKKVIIRTVELLLEIFQGQISNIYSFNINNYNYIHKKITLFFHTIDKILGFNINKKNIKEILIKLGFFIIKKTIHYYIIQIPSWRNDINIEEDIIEEIIRIYGYNKIPNNVKIYLTENNILKNNKFKLKNDKINIKKIKNILIQKGYYEVINYSFINPKIQSILYPKINCIKINNPITKELSVMRNSLLYGLINNIIYNQNRQQKNLRFFEYGLCFYKNSEKKLGILQKFVLSGIVNGNIYEDYWNEKNRLINFYDLKGDLESIFSCFIKKNKIEFRKNCKITILHPNINSLIYFNNIYIGYIGMLHPQLINYFNIENKNTFFFELFFNKIIINNIFSIKKVINFPINRRDISFIINKNIYFRNIVNELNSLNLKEIIKINIFDIYKGKNIPVGFKSITLSLFIQNKKYTLNEKEINFILNKCISKLKEKFQILLRDHII